MKTVKELYENLTRKMGSLISLEKGQTIIEYALIIVLISLFLIFVFRGAGLDKGVSTAGSKVNSALQ
jgi:Flp pilus assembly pilin Flp